MPKNTPVDITVLMPVYNSEKYLKEAIESILGQTYRNFELLIINDGSSDTSDEIIRSFKDIRISYINNRINQGIVAALNEGLRLSNGKYIARMDADDIANPKRLELQYQFLTENPEYKLCGTSATTINNRGEEISKIKRPYSYPKIKVLQLFRNAFIHPTIMADASVIKGFEYQKEYEYAEDYFLFSQIAMQHKVANLKYDGIKYRIHDESISSQKLEGMIKSEKKAMAYILSFLFEEVSSTTLEAHHWLLRPPQNVGIEETNIIENHLLHLKKANKIKQVFATTYLAKQLQKEWRETLKRSSEKNKFNRFMVSKLFSLHSYSLKNLLKLLFA